MTVRTRGRLLPQSVSASNYPAYWLTTTTAEPCPGSDTKGHGEINGLCVWVPAVTGQEEHSQPPLLQGRWLGDCS